MNPLKPFRLQRLQFRLYCYHKPALTALDDLRSQDVQIVERRRKIDEGKIDSPVFFFLSQAPLSLAAHDLTRSPPSERLEQAKNRGKVY